MKAALLNRPSEFLPVVMSATALAIVSGYAVIFGVAPQADEGIAAHIRNPALIEEDARLLDRRRKRAFGAKPAQTVKLSPDSRVGQRFKA
jgi:hypothetical protein